MFNVIYISTLCSDAEYSNLFREDQPGLSRQMQRYNSLLARGLQAQEHVGVTVISARPVNRANFRRVFAVAKSDEANGIHYRYTPIVNVRFVRSFVNALGAIILSLASARRFGKSSSAILCDSLNISLLAAAKVAGRILGCPVVALVTDVPGRGATDEGRTSSIRDVTVRMHQEFMKRCAGFVFLTEQMNCIINTSNRPFRVVEGQVDSRMRDVPNNLADKHEPRVVMYAGSVSESNGVDLLVGAFARGQIEGGELHVFGSGPYSPELEDAALRCDAIRYHGSASNETVIREEIGATLLVNPRPSTRDFVNYSFPSKLMEYMASGTPVLTTRLPVLPRSFGEHLFFIEVESVDGVADSICQLLAKPRAELHKKGLDAKQFVLSAMDDVTQARAIVEMLQELC